MSLFAKVSCPAEEQTEPKSLLWWGGLTLVLVILTVPILAVEVPPLTDYPNHLARCFFLAFGADDPVLRTIFAVRWAVIPNLAVDLILPPLMRVMPPLVAGKLIVVLAVLLPTTGAIALNYACFRRLSLWQLCSGFVAYNAMFLVGLLNFQLAVGVALWGAATWISASRGYPVFATVAGACFATVSFVFHIFGFCFFALLIGSSELVTIIQRGLGSVAAWRFTLRRGIMVLIILLPPSILYLLSPIPGASGPIGWQPPIRKLFFLLVPVLGYSRLISIAVALALLLCALSWAGRGRLRVAPLAWFCIPALLIIYLVLPLTAKGAFYIDTRVPVMLAFTLFATTMPSDMSEREGVLHGAVLSAFFVLQMAYITDTWLESRQDVADVRQVLMQVTPGSRVLSVEARTDQSNGAAMPSYRYRRGPLPAPYALPGYLHFAAFAMIDHRAYWSDAFAISGQQPITKRPPYDLSGEGNQTEPFPYTALAPFADAATSPRPSYFLAGWPDKFDYVLLLNAEQVPDLVEMLPQYLTLLDHKGIAALFRVRH
jgi:hypothetical protein